MTGQPSLMDDGSSYFIHQCGLKQRNIVNNDGYCALFVVNTPAVDDSGVGHAVEHFVFRRSKAFNDASTLFQLTSLTDLTINASTCSRVTYFHCQSQCQETFELGLRFLLSGLIKPLFCDSDLKYEIHDGVNAGVIYRELSGSQFDDTGRRQSQIDKSDTSPERTHQYGGDSRFISKITTDDLKNYHAQHYQPKTISLVTANVSTSLVSRLLEPIIFDNCGDPIVKAQQKYHPMQQQLPHQFESEQLLARWWLEHHFFNYFERHYSTLSDLLFSINAELAPLQLNLNKNSHFSFNVIVNRKNSELISAVLKQFIVDNPPPKYSTAFKLKKSHNRKYSPAINRLLEVHSGNQSELAQPSRLSIGVPTLHPLTIMGHQDIPENNLQKTLLKPASQRLLDPLVELSNRINQMKPGPSNSTNNQHQTSAIPKLLNSLYQEAIVQLGDGVEHLNYQDAQLKGVAVSADQNHCILVTQLAGENYALATLASYIIGAYPPFLAPRTQGHCYLIAVIYLETSNHLVIFSALDVKPVLRIDSISQSLSLLSRDADFITKSLELAKIKYCDIYRKVMSETNDISPTALAEFLQKLSAGIIKVSKDNVP